MALKTVTGRKQLVSVGSKTLKQITTIFLRFMVCAGIYPPLFFITIVSMPSLLSVHRLYFRTPAALHRFYFENRTSAMVLGSMDVRLLHDFHSVRDPRITVMYLGSGLSPLAAT